MGVVDDLRKALQDVVAPDLKALTERVEALEKVFNVRADALEQRLDTKTGALDTKIGALDTKIGALDTKISALDSKFEAKIAALDQKIDLKFDLVMSTMANNQAEVRHLLEVDRRLERLENAASAPAVERHS